MGAKGKYTPEIVSKIAEMYASGDYFIKNICEANNITQETFYTWKKTKPDFSESLKEAHDIRIKNMGDNAEKGLSILTGVYEWDETTHERKSDPQTGEYKMVLTKTVRKVSLPNPTACIYVTKNANPDKWSDRRELDLTTGSEPLNLPDIYLAPMSEIKSLQDEQREQTEG